jgi:hypothetical protein
MSVIWCRRCRIPYTQAEAQKGPCAACGEALPIVPSEAPPAEKKAPSAAVQERDEGGSEVVWCRACRTPHTPEEAKAARCVSCGTPFIDPATVPALPPPRRPHRVLMVSLSLTVLAAIVATVLVWRAFYPADHSPADSVGQPIVQAPPQDQHPQRTEQPQPADTTQESWLDGVAKLAKESRKEPGTAGRPKPPPGAGETVTEATVPLVAPVEGTLRVQYKCGAMQRDANQLMPRLRIVNGGDAPVPLNELTLRYWYTADGATAMKCYCDWAALNGANLTMTIHPLQRPVASADHYLEIGFKPTAGVLKAGGDSGEMQFRLHKTDWKRFDQSDDYSFDPAMKDYADCSHVTLYRKGVLVWGQEPGTPTRRGR